MRALILIAAAFFMAPSAFAQTHELDIKSDSLNIDNSQNQAEFTGNVEVEHHELMLFADRVEVFYKDTENGRSVEQVKAYGNVKMTRDDKTALGDRGVYLPDAAQVTMFDNVRVKRADDQTLYGTKMLYDLTEGRITLSSDSNRVRAKLGQNNTEEARN